MSSVTTVKGFKDILPEEAGKWRSIEEKVRKIFADFGIREIRTPVLEKTDLFRRGIGDATDIVEKEMYTFVDQGEESLTLRPEATASIIRAYIEHALYAADPRAKLFTIGPMFRRERPQKGRYRQFHQIDVEYLGYDDPRVDAEVIMLLLQLLKDLGLADVKLEINTLGCVACRPSFRQSVLSFLEGRKEGLCEDCRRRLNTNPLRVFDCKGADCRRIMGDAPRLIDVACESCRKHFETVTSSLTDFGHSFFVNTAMVRGLDYYTRTTFEITTEFLGAQNAVVGGGRYDGLVKDLGGPDIPGIGFAIGMERLISLLPLKVEDFAAHPYMFIAALGDDAQKRAFSLCHRLRLRGIPSEMDYGGKSLKSQMKRANKLDCRYALIFGDRELAAGNVELRDMRESTQVSLSIENIEETIANRFGEEPTHRG